MRKFAILSCASIGLLAALFLAAGRNVAEFTGYFRASADTAVDGVVESLPREVHDRKLTHDLRQARKEVIDRQVQLNLSRGQLESLRDDVDQLQTRTDRRRNLLAEAYPALKSAAETGKATIRFASTDYQLPDFQRHLDDLLLQQEQEERQLKIKREGLARLEKNAQEAERALGDMRRAMETTEQEIAVLKSRREQAELESSTLDMVAAAGASTDDATTPINASMTKLRKEVEELEARNQARRHLTPVAQRAEDNPLGRGWSRLESLKAIHDEVKAEAPAVKEVEEESDDTDKITASKVVIEVEE